MLLKLFVSLGALMLVMGILIFIPAGSVDYWQAWLFLVCYFLASLAISFWLISADPALLERRMRGGPFAERERNQKIIMTITSLGFAGLLVVPGLDHRFGWSRMPDVIAVFGDLLLFAGWYGIYLVFRANSYAASTIQVATDQKVISTGPYAVIRHPMYATALLMLLGIPIALGSWWGILVLVGILPALAWRLLDEERVLVRDLEGYADYKSKVRFRMISGIW